jgi:Ca2+-binding EF-hand superfamily protein
MMSGIGNNLAASLMQRPDPSQIASTLFSKLDSKNQGYIEKSDLQSAFAQISGAGDSVGADELFTQLDSDGNGKLTSQEMSDSLTRIMEQLDSQFDKMRMGGMPPPPPPGAESAGLSKADLQSQLDEIGSGDSKLSSSISNIIDNFDKADTNGDGKVSMQEAMTYDQSSQSGASSAASDTGNSEANIMMKIMQLLHAYSDEGQGDGQTGMISIQV